MIVYGLSPCTILLAKPPTLAPASRETPPHVVKTLIPALTPHVTATRRASPCPLLGRTPRSIEPV